MNGLKFKILLNSCSSGIEINKLFSSTLFGMRVCGVVIDVIDVESKIQQFPYGEAIISLYHYFIISLL